MHQLGEELNPGEKKERIRRILTARRRLYNAGVELIECDHVYAEGIKAQMERHTFASHMLPFEGGEAEKKQIDEADVRFYLEMRMRIYVREENIMFDAENGLCKIRLNDVLTANIPIKSGTAIRSILL